MNEGFVEIPMSRARELRDKAALLEHYCEWVRWRKKNGSFHESEQDLLDRIDAIGRGESLGMPDYWVRNDEEARAHMRLGR